MSRWCLFQPKATKSIENRLFSQCKNATFETSKNNDLQFYSQKFRSPAHNINMNCITLLVKGPKPAIIPAHKNAEREIGAVFCLHRNILMGRSVVAHGLRTPAGSPQRYAYIDTTRVLMMVLGVLFHVSGMFALVNEAPLQFDTRNSALDHLQDLIHSFRMEAFFFIDGFMATLVLSKYSPIQFLEKRAIRLMVPFCSTLLACVIPMHHFIEDKTLNNVRAFSSWHLWFLPALMVCAIVHAAIFRPTTVERFIVPVRRFTPAVILLTLAIAGAVIFLGKRVMWRLQLDALSDYLGGAIAFGRLSHLTVYYFLGAILWHYRSKLADILAYWPLYLSISAAPHVANIIPVNEYLEEYLQGLAAITTTLTFFAIGRAKSLRFLSTPWCVGFSMSLYLFHFPVMLLLRQPVMDHFASIWIRFGVVVVVTTAICAAIHWLILRSEVLSFLFNGETKVAGTSAPAVPVVSAAA
jgi:glucan biosynthesis protein C